MRLRLCLALLLVCVACGAERTGPRLEPDRSTVSTMATVPAEQASVVLFVSAEAEPSRRVGLRVAVNGAVALDDAFATMSSVNVKQVPLALADGAHRLTVVADDGTALHLSITVPTEQRYILLTYWSTDETGTTIDHRSTAVAPQYG